MTRAPLAVLAALAVALLALLTRRTDLVLELQNTYAGLAERMDRYSGLSRWLDWQEGVAWEQLLRNVHPPGTEPGCVVASPSTFYPDYWFQWTRDSAIVMRTVVDSYISGNMTMRPLLDEYVEASYRMQHQQTLIGGIDDGGLGEVKFHVNGTPFVGEWSRPQNDGPASRAITLIRLAGHLIEMGERQSVLDTFWQGPKGGRGVIQVDLDWVAGHWREPSSDLWEEVAGSHYYTLLAIRQALALGATLATALDDSTSAARYSSQVPLLDLALEEFYSEDKGVIQVTLNHTRGRKSVENARPGDDVYGKTSALDVAVILGVLHSARDGEGTRFDDERVLLTLGRLAEEMGKTYPLNKGRKVFAIGRYPEDLYDGTGLSLAHPWFLCTLAAAEYLYLLATHHASAPFLITPRSARAHFAQFLNLPPLKQDMQVLPGSKEMRRIVKGERALGDQYLSIVREFGSRNGSLHEQFNRMSGQGEGARDLTWSYAALITAAEARRGGSRPLVVEPQRYTTVVW